MSEQRFEEVKKAATILQIRTMKLLKVAAEAITTDNEDASRLDTKAYTHKSPKIEFIGGERVLVTKCKVEVFGVGESNAPIRAVAEYEVQYFVEDEKASVEDFSAFLETNTLFHAWPYFRELFHSISGRMEIRPVVLPFLKKTIVEKPRTDEAAPILSKE